jgi:hypothetical protein
MEQKNTHLTYGLVTGLAVIVLGLVLHLVNLSFNGWAQYVELLVFLVGILMNAFAFSKAHDADVTFGKVFTSCFKASAIVTLLMVAWTVISMMIFPEIKEKGIEMAMDSMAKQGMTDEQIEQGISMTKNYFTPFAIGGALFMFLFWGALFSLVGAAIAKKNPQPRTQS